ncbi:hypothetical protein SeLEV6574_g03128 [Synchytrium endobioticum]|uniref:YCII-related domain-containing protein n=1 Tax=Synchytrium endobioticum TaxID=286115 RepID=A0A507D5Y4_9FUNG|nr:hypothetical protein SeLEV6574_g03128 [Synchytrium endobioticum]
MTSLLSSRLAKSRLPPRITSKLHPSSGLGSRPFSASKPRYTQTWALIAPDYEHALSKRMKARDAHLARAKENKLTLGAAMLDEKNGAMKGSILVFEAPSREAAEKFINEGEPLA